MAGAATALPPVARAASAGEAAKASPKQPRNIIFLVVDGMGTGTLSLANHWSLQKHGEPLNWMQLYNHPSVVTALQDTASADSPVTDSAAAASAWGCGWRVPNRRINTTADGQDLKPIFSYAREKGKATGLVTTCRVTHATPAGFVANVAHRDEEDAIAQQYLEREVDVILGGGRRHFDGGLRSRFEERGHLLLEDLAGLTKTVFEAKATRLLGLFSEDHVPYAIDRENDPALKQVPGLAAMTRAALEVLDRAEKGFILQVESGRVDHAGHANDPAAILREQLEFDAVIRQVYGFQEAHPDTLVIVATDHGTGGCQLDGVGPGYTASGAALASLGGYTASTEAIVRRLEAGAPVASTIAGATGREPTKDEVAAASALLEEKPKGYGLANGLAEILYAGTGVGWTSHNHTAECVETLAFGPGSSQLKPFIENRELFNVMLGALAWSA